MSALKKARLAEMTATEPPQEVGGPMGRTSVSVQFNPTTLRVQISNRTAGGAQAGAQARQRPGTGEMQVSFDLVFDTADEGRAGAGISVLERTKAVERFVRPRGNQPGQEAPPRVLFEWGSFQVQGVMENANIDLDLFDADGVPLRAKVAVTIKGQDPRWRYQPTPGAASPAGPPPAARPGGVPALPAGAPGTTGSTSVIDRIVQALPGESLAQLASRQGLAPDAWRALAQGIGDPLKLALGQEVGLPASHAPASADGGAARSQDPAATGAALPLLGAAPAVAGAGAAAAAAGPTPVPPGAAAAAADPVRAGQALAARGGARSAIERQRGLAHAGSATRSLAAFGQTGSTPAALDNRPWGAGVPLRPRRGGAAAAPPQTGGTTLAAAVRATGRCGCGGRCGRCSGR